MRVEVNGTRLWFDVDGPVLVPDGPALRELPTVVLLHGGPGGYDHSYFKPHFGRLASTAQVVYLDQREHGRSARGDPAGCTMEVWADDVRAFCDGLGLARPVVFGHSFGGMVALAYAVRHPGHAGALVLQSTIGRWDHERLIEGFRRAGGDEVAEIAERSYGGEEVTSEEWERCRVLFGPAVPNEDERARILRHPEVGERGLALMREFDVLDRLGHVECPALVSVGELDFVTPPEAARELVDALPSAQLAVVPGAGHFPWLDVPDRYWPVVAEFVAAQD